MYTFYELWSLGILYIVLIIMSPVPIKNVTHGILIMLFRIYFLYSEFPEANFFPNSNTMTINNPKISIEL